jgi:hypothetical protein
MERIFSKVKIFLLKKIVFPVLQLIAKYKAKKIQKRGTTIYDEIKQIVNKIIGRTKRKRIKNPGIRPKQYGEYLQQTGKQIWVKKKNKIL